MARLAGDASAARVAQSMKSLLIAAWWLRSKTLLTGPRAMNCRKKVLVIEGDRDAQHRLQQSLNGYKVVTANDRASALAEFRRHEPPVVIHDLGSASNGGGVGEELATIREILAMAPYTKMVVITTNGDRRNAVKVVGLGIFELCPKPIDTAALASTVERACQMYELEQENLRLMRSEGAAILDGIIAKDDCMLKICRLVEKAALSGASVLLLGETGTGKEIGRAHV